MHFDVLTGASKELSVLLCSVIPIAAFVGVLLAVRLRSTAPLSLHTLGHRPAAWTSARTSVVYKVS